MRIIMFIYLQSVTDMSPYVRKTAANAIPKLYRYVPLDIHFAHMLNLHTNSLDPDQKEQLVEVIEKLLKDQTTVSLCYNRVTNDSWSMDNFQT